MIKYYYHCYLEASTRVNNPAAPESLCCLDREYYFDELNQKKVFHCFFFICVHSMKDKRVRFFLLFLSSLTSIIIEAMTMQIS